MAASSNTRSGGNNKDIQKAKDKAEIKRMINPNTDLKKAQNLGRGLILGAGVLKAVTAARAGAAGAAAERQALARSAPKTSKTMNVPKGTKVITSTKGGSANATSGVKKVTVQKSPTRSAAAVKNYAAGQGRAASALSQTVSRAEIKAGVIASRATVGIVTPKKPVKKK